MSDETVSLLVLIISMFMSFSWFVRINVAHFWFRKPFRRFLGDTEEIYGKPHSVLGLELNVNGVTDIPLASAPKLFLQCCTQ
jgi:hypothetical protein